MSGHSKWSNIKNKKGKADEKRAKIFTKFGREIIVAVKQGASGDPSQNPRLRAVLQKARENNMPNDNINRLIQKALGDSSSDNYEEIVYEGYGPYGVAVMLDIMTDNRNRTAGEIRHLFSKHGGSLGETGCVAWMFETKGMIRIDQESFSGDFDELMLLAIEAGAEDVSEEDGFIVYTDLENLETVKDALTQNGLKILEADRTKIPQNTIEITDLEQAKQVVKLIELLEDHDDVQNAYANLDISDEIAEQLG